MTITLNPVPLSLNAPMPDRIRYALDTIDPEDLYEYVKGLEDIMHAVNDKLDNPYADFFDDCVGALNGHWPEASIEDETLLQVILDAITKGDTSE